jgi:threonylcarbamoyladenosine tRNA methylthiotransferase MtaB
MRNKYKIYTLGCKVNQYDSASLGSELEKIGFKSVNKEADWVIVNTCAVTKIAIRKGRQMLTKARRENPEAKVILMGCWPKAYPELKSEMKADYIFTVREAPKIIDLIIKKSEKVNINSKLDSRIISTDRSRYFVKIQDGCEQFCSYCIIPYTRGKLKSRDEDEVIEEISRASKARYPEIVLTGIHLGLFGQEKGENRLVPLIKNILKIEGLGRIRLSSIEVTEISDELINLIRDNDKFCRHLHIPLQAGTDKILKLMNRPYDTKYFVDKIKKLRKEMPDIAITCDVIVGFPGETEKDFEQTCEFIWENKFSKSHIFSFSAHEKTPAFNMPNKVDPREIKRRSDVLHQIDEKLQKEYQENFKNKKLKVVVEGEKDSKFRGKTEYFFDVFFDKKQIICHNNIEDKLFNNLVEINNI